MNFRAIIQDSIFLYNYKTALHSFGELGLRVLESNCTIESGMYPDSKLSLSYDVIITV